MMRFVIGMLVGISLAATVLLIPQARERMADLAALIQTTTTMVNTGVVTKNKTDKFDITPKPLTIPPKFNDLATRAADLSSVPAEPHQLEEDSPAISIIPTRKDTPALAAEGFDPRAAEGFDLRAAEGFELRGAEGSHLRAAEGSHLRAAEGSFQPIWVPFRSEVSARGFATRLQRQVSTEFQVVKIGPGKYEVGFLYDSIEQLNNTFRKVSSLTGLESRLATRTSTGLAAEIPEGRMAD